MPTAMEMLRGLREETFPFETDGAEPIDAVIRAFENEAELADLATRKIQLDLDAKDELIRNLRRALGLRSESLLEGDVPAEVPALAESTDPAAEKLAAERPI